MPQLATARHSGEPTTDLNLNLNHNNHNNHNLNPQPSTLPTPEPKSTTSTDVEAPGSTTSSDPTPTTKPNPFRRRAHQVTAWLRGPNPPRTYTITLLLPKLQSAPISLLAKLLCRPWQRLIFLLVLAFAWLVAFASTLDKAYPHGSSSSSTNPVPIACTAAWWNTNSCGLNGQACRPFDDASFSFRCPAGCAAVQVLNPRAVGVEQVLYKSLVVGGPVKDDGDAFPNVYRGDSFICAAAIHAGVIENLAGGCGRMNLIGERTGFRASRANGIDSVGFNASFPLSFEFVRTQAGETCSSTDPQWRVLGISVAFTVVLSLLTDSAAFFFASNFAIVFFQVGLASDRPNGSAFDEVVSTIISRFLPAALIAVLIYRFCVRYTLRSLKAHFEKTILWLGPCWVGALSNYTLKKIPIQRLNAHDLRQQPGAIAALVVIIIVIVILVLFQAWHLRNEGRLLRYLAIYGLLVLGILLLLSVPRQNLRLHHYIIALLLLPGTAIQTRASLICQGLLIGLFINGTARWGFDSILQTSLALRADAQLGSVLPVIAAPIITATTITFNLRLPPPTSARQNQVLYGVSALVNDVERFREYEKPEMTFTWDRSPEEGNVNETVYFRFAYLSYVRSAMSISLLDYTKAGMWQPDGEWVHMQPGAS